MAGSGAGAGAPAADRRAITVAGPASRVLPALDGLRGVAALAVLMTHVGFSSGAYGMSWLGPLLARFDVGVALFFVLSGFLLTRAWVRARGMGARPSVRRYGWHRCVRILPAYWLALLAVLLTTARGSDLAAVASNAALLQIYTGDMLPGFTQTWSLVTEVAFYAVLPLIAGRLVSMAATHPRRAVTALVAACLVAWAWAAAAAAGALPSDAALWLPGHLDWFALGMALAILEPAVRAGATRTGRTVQGAAAAPWSVLALVGALLWLASTPAAGPLLLYAPSPWQAVTKEVLYAAIAVLLVGLGAFTAPHAGPVRILSSRPMTYLGHLSYAVFLWHLLVLELLMAAFGIALFSGGLLPLTVATVAVTVLVAAASWHLLERPLLRRIGAHV